MNLYNSLLKLKNKHSKIVGGIATGIATVTLFVTLPSCKNENQIEETEITTEVSYEIEEEMVNSTKDKIYNLNIDIDDDTVVYDSSLMILLSLLAPKDENGKISPDTLNHFKNIVNVDSMINNYDTLLNKIENGMINDRFVYLSDVLPIELSESKTILRSIENIAKHAFDNKNDKQIVLEAFDKMYTLFVEEKEVDGFEVRDLPFSIRTAASAYAREVTVLARNYTSSDKLEEMDKRTNDQNAKSYMVNILSMVSNQIDEESETDVIKMFNNYYSAFHTVILPIAYISEDVEKDLVNYINLSYLTSDKVSTKDRNTLVGDFAEEKVTNVLVLIDAITKYNYNTSSKNNESSSYFGFEDLLVDKKEHDVLALKFVESNSRRLLKSINKNTSYEELKINPYYNNLCKFITKLETGITHKYVDESGKELEEQFLYQNISDSVVFVCDEIIRYTFSILKEKTILKDNVVFNTYDTQTLVNSMHTIQYLQNTIYGECEKVDEKVYFKKSE